MAYLVHCRHIDARGHLHSARVEDQREVLGNELGYLQARGRESRGIAWHGVLLGTGRDGAELADAGSRRAKGGSSPYYMLSQNMHIPKGRGGGRSSTRSLAVTKATKAPQSTTGWRAGLECLGGREGVGKPWKCGFEYLGNRGVPG